jgi:hypothetical protein
VRVNEVGIARGTTRSEGERGEEAGQQRDPPRLGTQVLGDSAAKGDAEVREVDRRDNAHIEARGASDLDRRGDEAPRHRMLRRRVRRR